MTRLAILPPLQCDEVLAWLRKNLAVRRMSEVTKVGDFYVVYLKTRETPSTVQALLKHSFGKAVRIV